MDNQPVSLLSALADSLSAAAQYNQNDQMPPAAILWPDKERQWAALLPLLRPRLPLLTLGDYDPHTRTGPAYWLRCLIDGALPDDALPPHSIPIIYLPGYGKQDLRAIEECPQPLQPLAELQYRGALWVHRNGRDWTVAGFLHSLGVAVGSDQATKEALARALPKLAAEPVAPLKQAAPLKAGFLNQLLHPDAVRQLLLWLNDPEGFQNSLDNAAWGAFVALCQQKYGFHPVKDGPLLAATKLGSQQSDWELVWQRFMEMPAAYPGLSTLLAQARPPQQSLFAEPLPYWPQDTQIAEAKLGEQLKQLRNETPPAARAAIAALEAKHGPRRQWVWAKLNQSPLAMALQHLVTLAEMTAKPLGGGTLAQLAQAYTAWGWQVDAAVLAALALVSKVEDVAAAKAAILPLYRPWLETAAINMQKLALTDTAAFPAARELPLIEHGTCILFCDALRFDLAQRLKESLADAGFDVMIEWRVAALPAVTATAKPAISPVAAAITGGNPGFEPVVRETGSAVNAAQLRKLLSEAGYQVLAADNLGAPGDKAWTEFGAIDQYGHQHGWKIAHHLTGELQTLSERVKSLLDYGWQQVVIITDHGWLLLPDGLPKVELPLHLTMARKGRCAILKEGADGNQQIVPWHWDASVRVAVAAGIGCYEAGKEYEHGGISPQECIVPLLIVTPPAGAISPE